MKFSALQCTFVIQPMSFARDSGLRMCGKCEYSRKKLAELYNPCSALASVVELHENWDQTKIEVRDGEGIVQCKLIINDGDDMRELLCCSMHGLQ